jgi:hypothetical protein
MWVNPTVSVKIFRDFANAAKLGTVVGEISNNQVDVAMLSISLKLEIERLRFRYFLF